LIAKPTIPAGRRLRSAAAVAPEARLREERPWEEGQSPIVLIRTTKPEPAGLGRHNRSDVWQRK
jgi:hypothetical protein